MKIATGAAALALVAGCILSDGHAWAAADGKALFAAKCASCHGKDAKGNPAMARMFKAAPAALDLSGGWTADSEKSRAAAIEKGRKNMPAFGGKLTAEERAVVIAFLKSGSSPAGEAPAAKPVGAPAPAPVTQLKSGLTAPATESERP